MTAPELAVAYFGNRYADHARADLAEIAALGATTVCHTCSEADLRWNPGNMAELVRIGRDAGLSSWFTPWALGGIFGGEAPSYAVMEHPDATQRDNHGRHAPRALPQPGAYPNPHHRMARQRCPRRSVRRDLG